MDLEDFETFCVEILQTILCYMGILKENKMEYTFYNKFNMNSKENIIKILNNMNVNRYFIINFF